MHTVLSSRSRDVLIGPDQPFCIIGERINPTGRKAFAAALRDGDLSEIVKDVQDQVAMGAHVLDVDVGRPADRRGEPPRRCGQARTGALRPADLHRLLFVEALEAGLAANEARRSSTRSRAKAHLERVLPMVKAHGAAIICLVNDEVGIPQTADERLEICGRLLDIVHGRYEIPLEDIVIDPLAMTVGADPRPF